MGCLVLASVIPFVIYFGRRQGAYLLPDLNPGELEAFLTRTLLITSTIVLIVGVGNLLGTYCLSSFVVSSTSSVNSGWLPTKPSSSPLSAFMLYG